MISLKQLKKLNREIQQSQGILTSGSPENKETTFSPGTKVSITDTFDDRTIGKTDIADLKDGILILNSPTILGRIIRLEENKPYNFLIHADNGLFSAWGMVIKQYGEYGKHYTSVKLSSHMSKKQRRKYYRLKCSLPAKSIAIQAKNDHVEILKAETELAADGSYDSAVESVILNISGGGAFITCKSDFGDSPQVTIRTTIKNKGNGRTTYEPMTLLADILEKTEDSTTGEFFYRLEFIFDDEADRKKVIKFVLDEQIRGEKLKQEEDNK